MNDTVTQNEQNVMSQAIDQAKMAAQQGEIPIGAVIVCNDKIIAQAYNKTEQNHDATAHAEILAIQLASRNLNNWRLSDCSLFVTVEPCLMCLGAILQSRIQCLYYGCNDPKRIKKYGGLSDFCSLAGKSEVTDSNHTLIVKGHVLEEECQSLIKEFFKERRQKS